MSQCPRILYISDIPVELSYAGPTLIYRLLEDYPSDRLLVVQGMEINASGRLPGVTYILQQSKWLERLKTSRFRNWLTGLLVIQEWLNYLKVKRLAEAYKPELIVTVSFRLKWLQGLWLSRRNSIPLHVILHDDWLLTERYGLWQSFLNRKFRAMYLRAAGKYCISDAMESHYLALFGVRGQVLFPTRGKSDLLLPCQVRMGSAAVTRFAYAGTLFTSDFASLLNRLSRVIGARGFELHLFTNEDRKALSDYEFLCKSHVNFHGMVGPEELRQELHDKMDVAILINSFEVEEAFRYNFSSKLVDYSTAGLPVLIWGPKSSGAISWAVHHGYQGVILHNDDARMESMVDHLTDSEFRLSLANHIQELGRKQFDYETNRRVFYDRITDSDV